jgi:hypothetical protein
MELYPDCLRAPPPPEVFKELTLARLLIKLSPDVTIGLPGGERVGLDWSVFGELVGREVEVRFRRRERDRPVAENEQIIVIFEGKRWSVARAPRAIAHGLDYREQPVTAAERLSIAAGRVDYSGQDLTRHAETAAPARPLNVQPIPFDASRLSEILGRKMLQVGRFEALDRLQRAGVLASPMTDEDKRRTIGWFGGSEVVNLELVDEIIRTGAPAPGRASTQASA